MMLSSQSTNKWFHNGKNRKSHLSLLLFILIAASIIINILPVCAAAAAETKPQLKLRLSAGFAHSAMIDYDGKLYFWGDNTYGQTGLADDGYYDQPALLVLPEKAVDISLGTWHSLVLTESGKVYSFGRNTFGQLGDGTYENSQQPIPVEGLPAIKAIAAGSYHSLALAEDGSVWGWGNNTNWQLAQAKSEDLTEAGQIVARRAAVPTLIVKAKAKAIAAGGHFSMYLSTQGEVYAWGDNSKGQLGDGTLLTHETPYFIDTLTNVTAIYAGYEYALAVTGEDNDKHQLHAWGDNALGQLGLSDPADSGALRMRPAPVDLSPNSDSTAARIISISAGFAHVTAAIAEEQAYTDSESDQTIYQETGRHQLLVWGANTYGQLGIGQSRSRYSPYIVSGSFDGYEGNSFLPFDAVAAGGNHTLVASSKGQLAASGRGDRGQLGTISIIDRDQLTLVRAVDYGLPAWSADQKLSVDFTDDSTLKISWPAAQDDFKVAGYKIRLVDENDRIQILEAGDKLERSIKNLNRDNAYSITVFAYDQERAGQPLDSLSSLYGSWLPEAYDPASWPSLFDTPISGINNQVSLLVCWQPDPSGARQPLEVPWSQAGVCGPVEPTRAVWPIAQIIQLITASLTVMAVLVWIGVNFHKERRLLHPLPPLPEKFSNSFSDFVNKSKKFFSNIEKGIVKLMRKISRK